jgi:hypothetical protein
MENDLLLDYKIFSKNLNIVFDEIVSCFACLNNCFNNQMQIDISKLSRERLDIIKKTKYILDFSIKDSQKLLGLFASDRYKEDISSPTIHKLHQLYSDLVNNTDLKRAGLPVSRTFGSSGNSSEELVFNEIYDQYKVT